MILLLTLLLLATSPEALTFLFAGYLTPYLTHLTKKFFSVDSLWAYSIHLFISIALSALSLWMTGGLNLDNLVDTTMRVSFLSQTLFQVWKQKTGLTIEPEVIAPPVVVPAEEVKQ